MLQLKWGVQHTFLVKKWEEQLFPIEYLSDLLVYQYNVNNLLGFVLPFILIVIKTFH